MYLGEKTNRLYAGPAPLPEMADTIHRSVGPSGKNKDYLHGLAEAMRELKVRDEHLEELEKAVRELDQSTSMTELTL